MCGGMCVRMRVLAHAPTHACGCVRRHPYTVAPAPRLSSVLHTAILYIPRGELGCLWVGMCIDMCTDMCMDMRIDMCIDMCMDTCMDMCVDNVRRHMCRHVQLFGSMCMDMCVGMCGGMQHHRAPEQ